MRTTERGLLANRSRLAQHMQANSRFVVSFSRCIYSMAKFILCLTACYCRDQASVTSHAHSCKLLFSSPFLRPVQSSPESRLCTVPFDSLRMRIETRLQRASCERAFTVDELLAPLDVGLNTPPFQGHRSQMD